jgi:hypothetical protein
MSKAEDTLWNHLVEHHGADRPPRGRVDARWRSLQPRLALRS